MKAFVTGATGLLGDRELDWRARSLEETLRDEVAWYRSHGMSRGDGQPSLAA